MDRELTLLVELLTVAAWRVEDEYFQLPVVDSNAVYRERDYYHELYHQLRCTWDHVPFSLGDELEACAVFQGNHAALWFGNEVEQIRRRLRQAVDDQVDPEVITPLYNWAVG